ncbi:MAG: hypothetical protein O2816_07685 [Planctomycetota bacterium]|nr:hypothetical protein [Planctomycetota bacterium]
MNADRDKATRLIEQQQNLDEVEQRLARMLDGPSRARHALTILSGLVVIGSGTVLVATFSQSPPGAGSTTMGMIGGLVMVCSGLVLLGASLAQMDMDRRERRLLRALRHLLHEARQDG